MVGVLYHLLNGIPTDTPTSSTLNIQTFGYLHPVFVCISLHRLHSTTAAASNGTASRRGVRLPRGAYRKLLASAGRLTWEPLLHEIKGRANQETPFNSSGPPSLQDVTMNRCITSKKVHKIEAILGSKREAICDETFGIQNAGDVQGKGNKGLFCKVSAARFSFALPTGAYATVLMREVTRSGNCLFSYL